MLRQRLIFQTEQQESASYLRKVDVAKAYQNLSSTFNEGFNEMDVLMDTDDADAAIRADPTLPREQSHPSNPTMSRHRLTVHAGFLRWMQERNAHVLAQRERPLYYRTATPVHNGIGSVC